MVNPYAVDEESNRLGNTAAAAGAVLAGAAGLVALGAGTASADEWDDAGLDTSDFGTANYGDPSFGSTDSGDAALFAEDPFGSTSFGTTSGSGDGLSAAEPEVVAPELMSMEPDPIPIQSDPIPIQPDPAPIQPDPILIQPDPAPTQPDPIPIQPELPPLEPPPLPTEPEPVAPGGQAFPDDDTSGSTSTGTPATSVPVEAPAGAWVDPLATDATFEFFDGVDMTQFQFTEQDAGELTSLEAALTAGEILTTDACTTFALDTALGLGSPGVDPCADGQVDVSGTSGDGAGGVGTTTAPSEQIGVGTAPETEAVVPDGAPADVTEPAPADAGSPPVAPTAGVPIDVEAGPVLPATDPVPGNETADTEVEAEPSAPGTDGDITSPWSGSTGQGTGETPAGATPPDPTGTYASPGTDTYTTPGPTTTGPTTTSPTTTSPTTTSPTTTSPTTTSPTTTSPTTTSPTTTGPGRDPAGRQDPPPNTSLAGGGAVQDGLRSAPDATGEERALSPSPAPPTPTSATGQPTAGNGGPGPILPPEALPYVFALSPLSIGINAYENGTVIGAKRSNALRAAGAPAAAVAAAANPLNNLREAATTLPRASVVDATLQNLPIDVPSTGNADLDTMVQSGLSGVVGAGTNMAAQYIQEQLPEIQRRNNQFYQRARTGMNVVVPTPRPITLALPARPLPYAAAPAAISTAVIIDREVRDFLDVCQPSDSDTNNLNIYCDIGFRSVAKGVGLQAAFAGDSLADQWALARRLSPGRALRETLPLVGTMAAQNAIAELLVVDPVEDDAVFRGLRSTAQTLSDVGTGANHVVNGGTDPTDGAGVNLARGYSNAALAIGMPIVEALTNSVDPVYTVSNLGRNLRGESQEPLVSRAGAQEADRRVQEAGQALHTGLRQPPTTALGAVGSAAANTLDGLGDALIGVGQAATSSGSPEALEAAAQRFRESRASLARAGAALGLPTGGFGSGAADPQATRTGTGNPDGTAGSDTDAAGARQGRASGAGNERGEAGSECSDELACVALGAGTPPAAGAAGAAVRDDRGGPGAVQDDRGGPGAVLVQEPVVTEGGSFTGAGVTAVAPPEDRVIREYQQTYTQADGLPGSRRVLETDTGQVYIGGPGGYQVYGPDGRPAQPGAVSSTGGEPSGSALRWTGPTVTTVSTTPVAPVAPVGSRPGVSPGGIALRPDVTAPLCSASVTSRCINPTSLIDEAPRDGVADNAGELVAGVGVRGPLIVGPGPRVGPRIVGPGPLLGPRIVGPGPLLGPRIVGPGPAASSPVSAPASRPASQPAASRPAASRPAARAPQPNPVGQVINGLQQQSGRLLDQAGQAWNNQPLTVRAVAGSNVEVTFMDRRVGVYNSATGNRVSGAGPGWVHPMQIATPGQALNELGDVIRNVGGVLQHIPPILPSWNPLQQAH